MSNEKLPPSLRNQLDIFEKPLVSVSSVKTVPSP